jgi:ribosomal protein S18 acetylase RimI-like enzyme
VRVASETFLRPATPDDTPFFREVYASTRAEELALTSWSAEQQQAFVDQQFAAQSAHYATHYPGASIDVVVVDDESAGRLYVHRGPSDIRIVDISLLPRFRGRGAGNVLVTSLIAEARGSGRTLSIHVEKQNPARRLYERLGFAERDDRGTHWFMVWGPATQPKTAS